MPFRIVKTGTGAALLVLALFGVHGCGQSGSSGHGDGGASLTAGSGGSSATNAGGATTGGRTGAGAGAGGASGAGIGGSAIGGSAIGGSAIGGAPGAGAGGTDLAAAGAPSAGGGEGTPSGAPIFLAGGYRGRTTLSCDDGATWIANHSDDDSPCPNHDCGEVFNTVTGLAFGGGYFFMSRGWGMPGNVLRSPDGVVWTPIYSGQQFGGVAFGSETLVIGSGWQAAWYSTNAGQTIESAQDVSGLLGANTGTIRSVSYHSYGGGRFLLIPDDGPGARKFLVSKDFGKTYQLGATAQDLCSSRVTDVVSGGNIIVSVSDETGYACRSLDGGETWSGKQISSAGLSRQLVWTGTDFVVYGGGAGYRSTDGDTWTRFTLSPAGLLFGALARSTRSGTLVASSPYGSDYGAQSFYRSTDGVTWQSLAAGQFVGSHLIEHMTFGFAQPSTACP